MNPEQRARELFIRSFGGPPAAVASAPGRVNLIGEHIDYHGGHVLPLATDLRTAVALGTGGGRVQAVSEQREPETWPWPARPHGGWSDYVAGVASLDLEASAILKDGLMVAVATDLPVGGGLSSSGALGVATALALAKWSGRPPPLRAVADLAWRAENEFVGVPCGQMDQIAAVFTPRGQAILLDCRTLEMHPVPVELDLVIVDSGEAHHLRASAYSDRRHEGAEALALLRPQFPALLALVDLPPARLATITRLLPPPLDKRVRHVVNENQRTLSAARALEHGDHTTFGRLVNASHDSLRDLYECSTSRLDAIVNAARSMPDVLGARLVGAGWGGSVLVVVKAGSGPAVAAGLLADETVKVPSAQLVRPGAGVVDD